MSFAADLLRCFTTVNIDANSGIIPQKGVVSAERMRFIRIWNFIEPFAVFGLIMLVMWTSGLDKKIWWVKPSLGGLLIWSLILSPCIHYPFERDIFLTDAQKRMGFFFYFFECRGLGSPFRYYLPMYGERPFIIKYWKSILTALMFMNILFFCALVTFNKEIMIRYAAHMTTPTQGILFRIELLLGIDAALVFGLFPFMIRFDNLNESLRFMFAFMFLIAVMALCANLLFQANESTLREAFKGNPYMGLRGDSAHERLKNLSIFAVGGQWSGYVFWGFLQELLFLGVFSAQFCRAFDVSRSKTQLVLACLCSASLFGMIHIPNFWLGLITFTGGFFGSLFAAQCRNLFTLGIVHGFGGTMFNRLLPINFSVGP
jgi:hypothetical protein